MVELTEKVAEAAWRIRNLEDYDGRLERAARRFDEISRARSFKSSDDKQAALLAFLEAILATDGRPSAHLAEEAREHGWTDEELLEAVAHVAMNEFQSLVANAADLPQDQENSTVLPAAA